LGWVAGATPETATDGHAAIVIRSFFEGFVVMMVLDVALG